MLIHIVKNGETINDILALYNLEFEEIQNCNLHITDFYNLLTGMKIKIPIISKEIEQILDNTESFVQSYYPKISELEDEHIEKKATNEEPIIEKNVDKSKLRAYPGILPPKKPYKRF